jgi:ATP-binding cassette subfamily B multidrug efflux pump
MKTTIKTVRHPEKLWSFFKSQLGTLIIITLSGLLYNFGMLANPIFQGRLIDAVNQDAYQKDPSQILMLLLYYVIAIAAVQTVRAIKRYYVRRFAYVVTASMRRNIYNNLLHETSQELKSQNIGTLISRAVSDTSNAVEGMRKLTTEIFDTVVLFIFYIVYLFLFDATITALSLISVAVAVVLSFVFRRLIFNASVKARKSNSQLSGQTFDLFDHALTYRVYGRDEDNLKTYDKTLGDYEKYNRIATVLTDTMIPAAQTVALLGLIPLIYLGSGYVISQRPLAFAPIGLGETTWTIGIFSTYLSTFVLMAKKASHTAKLFSSIENGLASWKRIQPFMKEYQDYPYGTKEDQEATLSLKDFSVTVDQRTLISSLNLEARQGQIIGITGPIASGKSVLGKALLGLLPYQGSATMFGKEISSYSPADTHSRIGYMPHQASLFTESLADNIALGEDKAVLPYLEKVDFMTDMESMPDKEKTIVGNEGVKLSGGQQERIALARTFYHGKKILILDDPFASVDVLTERKILANLREETKASLVLFVSHRLTAFPDLDQIIVLDGQGGTQVGTHEELLASSPTYQSLWALQVNANEVSHA